MTSSTLSNRRETHRTSVAFDLKVEAGSEAGHQFYTGLIKDMSAGGLFIATRDHLPDIGERFAIRFSFPPIVEEAVEITVEVCWQRVDENNTDYPTGVGVKFIDLPDRLAVKIGTYVADKDVLLWEDDDYSEWGDTNE